MNDDLSQFQAKLNMQINKKFTKMRRNNVTTKQSMEKDQGVVWDED